ncbi:MAG: BolA family protein [Gammaproteobacteria bacterium]
MTPQHIKALIESAIPHTEAIVDGDGGHFRARVISPAFGGLATLQRHRLVYAGLGTKMETEIHALSMRTYTPEEWAAARPQ